MDSYQVLEDQNGWWDRLTLEDRERAMTGLLAEARSRADSSGILDEVRVSMQQRITDIITSKGSTITFVPLSSSDVELPIAH